MHALSGRTQTALSVAEEAKEDVERLAADVEKLKVAMTFWKAAVFVASGVVAAAAYVMDRLPAWIHR